MLKIFGKLKAFILGQPYVEPIPPLFQDHPTEIADIRIPDDMSLYQALRQRDLLKKPGFPKSLGLHLVRDGQIGLTMNNGKPEFLAPGGRYTFWSPFRKLIKIVPITDDVIELGPYKIVTIPQGELGVTIKNGTYQTLEPGRYILRAPHRFLRTEQANGEHVNLGIEHRITVPEGQVGIAFNEGRIQIIEPTKERFETVVSPTFRWIGLRATRRQEKELDKLRVYTRDQIPVDVEGVIRYEITHPLKAFFETENVDDAIKLQAEAMLTSVFSQLSVEQISASLTSAAIKDREEEIPEGLIDTATDLIFVQLKDVLKEWGVQLDQLNIKSMRFSDQTFIDVFAYRAQEKVKAETLRETVEKKNKVFILEAERKQKEVEIAANAEADAARIRAQGQADAAAKLEGNPMAEMLARGQLQVNISKALADGGKAIFVPTGAGVNFALCDATLFGGNGRENVANRPMRIDGAAAPQRAPSPRPAANE